jgi:hypothetical protein
MGAWGPGNFDNHDALNYIDLEMRRLISTIEAVFTDEDRFHLDEEAEGCIIPSVVLLSLLCKHCHAILPKSLNIASWKDQYLQMYDHEIAGDIGLQLPENFAYQRRAIIAATFDKLLQQQYAMWTNENKEYD